MGSFRNKASLCYGIVQSTAICFVIKALEDYWSDETLSLSPDNLSTYLLSIYLFARIFFCSFHSLWYTIEGSIKIQWYCYNHKWSATYPISVATYPNWKLTPIFPPSQNQSCVASHLDLWLEYNFQTSMMITPQAAWMLVQQGLHASSPHTTTCKLLF